MKFPTQRFTRSPLVQHPPGEDRSYRFRGGRPGSPLRVRPRENTRVADPGARKINHGLYDQGCSDEFDQWNCDC
jgi:hypothetical protein